MTDLRGIHEPVPFDWDAADALVAQLTARAVLLRAQGEKRNPFAAKARTDWRGVYAGKFGERMKVCLSDAERLATAMDKAADQVKELAKLAREEQERRDVAKQYELDLKAWQERRDRRGVLETGVDGVSVFFGASDDKPQPPSGPKSTRVLTAEAPSPTARGE